jgi:DNA (cytosine-5)-methyltransferase 1
MEPTTSHSNPTFGSLFTGIGGFDLGFARAGYRPLWMCECEPYCRKVLHRRFPGIPVLPDVRTLDCASLQRPTVVVGGSPCQDISEANPQGLGLEGAKSGLWFEMLRVVSETRPEYVVLENVSAIRTRDLATVLSGLAEVGYDAEWDTLRAADFGAPHERARLWLVAYRSSKNLPGPRIFTERARKIAGRAYHSFGYVADTLGTRFEEHQQGAESVPETTQCSVECGCSAVLGRGWRVEPDMGRVADGVPYRVDRLRSLGNALTPVIAEWLANVILEDMRSVRWLS